MLSELRIKNGQAVKRDEIIAVLNNYAVADVEVRRIESEITKARRQRETMVSDTGPLRSPFRSFG